MGGAPRGGRTWGCQREKLLALGQNLDLAKKNPTFAHRAQPSTILRKPLFDSPSSPSSESAQKLMASIPPWTRLKSKRASRSEQRCGLYFQT